MDVMKKVWGTWEELILGGAVLRHGTGNWDVISSEVRARTYCPDYFTPQACRARYEDLQQHYTGCKYWYDELRERRVSELKRALDKSEESIGFLVSKLENLKSRKGNCEQIYYDSSQTESPPLSLPITKGVKITTVVDTERSKDESELSAGSFIHDLETNPQPKIGASNEKGGTIRKRRGKRKRKEGIVECEVLGSSSGCGQAVRLNDDLVGVFNSVTENQYASVFRRRLNSQKRARYRKTVKQHMDLDTIKSRIANNCIKSTNELFKDLLLLTNNALVFYSKRTFEYKSALTFRSIVSKRYKQLCSDSSSRPLSSILCFSSMSNRPPVRPRSVRPRGPCNQPKLVVKFLSNSDSGILNRETEGERPRMVGGGKQPSALKSTNRKRTK